MGSQTRAGYGCTRTWRSPIGSHLGRAISCTGGAPTLMERFLRPTAQAVLDCTFPQTLALGLTRALPFHSPPNTQDLIFGKKEQQAAPEDAELKITLSE